LEDPRFKTLANRVANIDQTYQETAKTMITRTTKEWIDLFGKTSVPTIVVNTLEDLITDEHLNAVGFWQSVDHPTEGKLKLPGFPINFSETPESIRRHAPRLGEHSAEVLKEAGLSQAEIDVMVKTGATLLA
jgi:crotonobetainyl-CoA:carnitine CoA-transferase CaiB-like acyl-CoA transferase